LRSRDAWLCWQKLQISRTKWKLLAHGLVSLGRRFPRESVFLNSRIMLHIAQTRVFEVAALLTI
jgi:hypothetical protein